MQDTSRSMHDKEVTMAPWDAGGLDAEEEAVPVQPWFRRSPIVVALLVLFPPLGIVLALLMPTWPPRTRLWASGASALWLVVALALPKPDAPPRPAEGDPGAESGGERPGDATAATADERCEPGIGQQAKLVSGPDVPRLFVAQSQALHRDLSHALAVNDLPAIGQLIEDRKVVLVKPGTALHVLEGSLAATKVRVVAGEHAQFVGWTSREWVVCE